MSEGGCTIGSVEQCRGHNLERRNKKTNVSAMSGSKLLHEKTNPSLMKPSDESIKSEHEGRDGPDHQSIVQKISIIVTLYISVLRFAPQLNCRKEVIAYHRNRTQYVPILPSCQVHVSGVVKSEGHFYFTVLLYLTHSAKHYFCPFKCSFLYLNIG